jgi:hypothetical protein
MRFADFARTLVVKGTDPARVEGVIGSLQSVIHPGEGILGGALHRGGVLIVSGLFFWVLGMHLSGAAEIPKLPKVPQRFQKWGAPVPLVLWAACTIAALVPTEHFLPGVIVYSEDPSFWARHSAAVGAGGLFLGIVSCIPLLLALIRRLGKPKG